MSTSSSASKDMKNGEPDDNSRGKPLPELTTAGDVIFMPLAQMKVRAANAMEESDLAFFHALLFHGEALTKTVVGGLVAAVRDDPERNRYRLVHTLVRAEGIGDWAATLDDVLLGPASQHLAAPAQDERREITQKYGEGAWQHEAVVLLVRVLDGLKIDHEELPVKVDVKKWFSLFALLRNKTRGHGALFSAVYTPVCPPLSTSIGLIVDNLALFRRPWAYLHRNLSGKYRVRCLGGTDEPFARFKTVRSEHVLNGVYVHFDSPCRVELMDSSPEALDFFYANGGFRSRDFEMLSYGTGDKRRIDGSAYLLPTGALPESETQGLGKLDVKGSSFTNLPSEHGDYVERPALERELFEALGDDRRCIVTLVGRGGIGKTSLALRVLNKLCLDGRYEVVVWFSARDIDLLPTGPKTVQPHVLCEADISAEFVELVEPDERTQKGFKAQAYFEQFMSKSRFGNALLVFDNFETARSPYQLFKWIDTFLRPPNRALITTRFREFKGDYFIEVGGMTEQECDRLIDASSARLGIRELLTHEYRQELYRESEGHPYVVKVLLGEVAKAKRLVKIERIIASREDILTALFERTYAAISPTAQRVFLTLCNWNSAVPKIALEAVMLRPDNERMDVSDAVEELERSSLVEVVRSDTDQQLFLSVPLVAAVFGKQKLTVSPLKTAVQADSQLLQLMGPSTRIDIRRGIESKVESMFATIARKVEKNDATLEQFLPILEGIARSYPPAWWLLAKLHQEQDNPESFYKARAAVEQYLQNAPASIVTSDTWRTLAELCRETGDPLGEANASVEMCQFPGVPFDILSSTANRLNSLMATDRLQLDSSEKQILMHRLAAVICQRESEADTTDYSRMAWLHMHLGDEQKAREYVAQGLRLEPDNVYCRRLAARLGIR